MDDADGQLARLPWTFQDDVQLPSASSGNIPDRP
jgi:hypothetical protein